MSGISGLQRQLNHALKDGKVTSREAAQITREAKKGGFHSDERKLLVEQVDLHRDQFERKAVKTVERLSQPDRYNEVQHKWPAGYDPEVKVRGDRDVLIRDGNGNPILDSKGRPLKVRDGDVAVQIAGRQGDLVYVWSHYDNSRVEVKSELARALKGDKKISDKEAQKIAKAVRDDKVSTEEGKTLKEFLHKHANALSAGARHLLGKVAGEAVKDTGHKGESSGFVRIDDLDPKQQERLRNIGQRNTAITGANGRSAGSSIGEFSITPQEIPEGLKIRGPNGQPYAVTTFGARAGNWANLLWNLPNQPGGGAVRTILSGGNQNPAGGAPADTFYLSNEPMRTFNADAGPVKGRITFAYGYTVQNGEKIWGWKVFKHELLDKQGHVTQEVYHQQEKPKP